MRLRRILTMTQVTIGISCVAQAKVDLTKNQDSHIKVWNTIFGFRVGEPVYDGDLPAGTHLVATEGWWATTLGPSNFAWSRRIGTAGPYSCCDGAPGLLPTPWTSGSDHTFTLDPAALPNADGSTTCILALLIQDGRLDVRVADDTAIDYMILRTTTCCKKRFRKLGPADVNDDLVINVVDVSLVTLRWLDDLRAPDVSDPNDPVPTP